MRQAFTIDRPHPATLRALNYRPELARLAGRNASRLGLLPCKSTNSFGDIFAARLTAPGHGIQLLSQVDTFSAEPSGKWVRPDSMTRPEEHQLRKWQICIAGAGQMAEGNLFGRSILVDDRLADLFVASDSVVLEFDEPGSDVNLWLYAFLNTKVGLDAVRSCAYGTSIPRLRLDLLRELPIPRADDATTARVASLVRQCVEQRGAYLQELCAARRVIEQLPDVHEAKSASAERKAQATMWTGPLRTLCAWNAASAGGALAMLQRRWSGRLGDVVPAGGIFYGPRFGRTTCEPPHGFDFLSQRDLFLIRPVPRRIAHPGFDDAKLFVQPDTVLVAAQGTLGEGEIFGRVMLARGQLSGAAYTQHVLRMAPERGYGALLFAVLSTLVGLRLLRSTAVGTKLLSMREDLLRDLPIPDLEQVARGRIGQHVDAAFTAREAAASAELEAIRIVEEEVLPAWLA